MVKNLQPQEMYDFIVGDFVDGWNSLARDRDARSRGNFMFARQAMTLLEWSSRLACADTSGLALPRLSAELCLVENRYFTPLPGHCANVSEFNLPSIGPAPESQLLWALYDLIRNGQAHQYQQIVVDLTDGKRLAVSLTGPGYGQMLGSARRRDGHLCILKDGDGDLLVKVRPDVLFQDVRTAIESAGLLSAGLSFDHLKRPRPAPRNRNKGLNLPYAFSAGALENSLIAGGLVNC